MNRSPGLLMMVLVTLLVAVPMAYSDAPQAEAADVKVKVAITRVIELNCDEGFPETCPNDYYPKFEIDGQGLFDGKSDYCCAHPTGEPTEFRTTEWSLEKTVDSGRSPVAIYIELWDQDGFSGDNPIDISKDDDFLALTFNLNTCTFQGDGLTPQQGAETPNLLQGHSEGNTDGGNNSRVYFTITTAPCIAKWNNLDSDGDALNNGWEIQGGGIDGSTPPDGIPDLALNSDPTHKDIFVEVDWMACSAGGCSAGATHSHAPTGGVLDDVVAAFRTAPVPNPDGTGGITLHAVQDEAVRDLHNILVRSNGPGTNDDFNDLKTGPNNVPDVPCDGQFGTAPERGSSNCANILAAKRLAYHYMIFGDSYSESSGSSGNAEGGAGPPREGGNDFIVTLGSWSPKTITDTGGGQRVAEASTFMHEFGHNLGLDHGGSDIVNCKPNYLSIMNYTLQFPIRDANRPLDYSSAARGTALSPLNENGGLNENSGIGGPAGRLTVFGVSGNQRTAQANGPINWNGNVDATGAPIFETNATADINFISTIGPMNQSGCSAASPNQTLNGFDDWQNIIYNFRSSSFFSDGATMPSTPELTEQTVRLMANPPPDLKVTKSVDKANAVGGDTLTYTVTATNLEPPKAVNVSVTDTLPDSSTQTRSLPDLNDDQSNTQTFTYLVPCATTDGAVLTNRASVTGTNSVGLADVNLGNNSAQATTTVQAPKLTLSKSATASVNAGEAITYTITYQNTGTGGAANIVITDTLPAGVYYSKALDTGAGPQPNTVTLNGDGTRTLTWLAGSLAGNSSAQTIQYTARPSLLFLGGETLSNSARLTFANANGCTYAPLTASASTVITVVPPSKDPTTLGFWRNHSELWTAEILARIQATDQRYDTNGGGSLSTVEVAAMFASGGNQPKVLQMQLLATYFNLATRRINAGTLIESSTANALGLDNVADAAIYGMDTLALPVNAANRPRYDNAITVLDEINNNTSEVY